jgi:hypothetical protein
MSEKGFIAPQLSGLNVRMLLGTAKSDDKTAYEITVAAPGAWNCHFKTCPSARSNVSARVSPLETIVAPTAEAITTSTLIILPPLMLPTNVALDGATQ